MVTVASWLTKSRPRPFQMSSASSAMFQWAVEDGVQAVLLLKSCSPSNDQQILVCQLGSRWSPAQAVGVGRCGVVRHSRGHATGRVLLQYQVKYHTPTRSAQVRSTMCFEVYFGYNTGYEVWKFLEKEVSYSAPTAVACAWLVYMLAAAGSRLRTCCRT
jgi:hypothetical protein